MGDNLTSAMLSEGFLAIKLFATGTQGEIYGAFDKKLDSMVAIKKLDISTPAQEEQLKHEITVIKKARHRNIIPILYALVRPRMALLVLPPKPINLHALIPLRYNVTYKFTAFSCLTIQMLSALTFLQEEGLSHRNVKPNNILVETSGPGFHFQLTDFALTQPVKQPDVHDASFIYKAPETYVDTYPITGKQDVWSLFVTLAVSCGYLSETDLSRASPTAVAWAVVEAGVQMYELEAMAQQNPTLRASASVMFHQLRPKERVNSRGEVDYPEISPDYVGLYGSGRLEKDVLIPLGPRADVRALIGPLGFDAEVLTMPPSTSETSYCLPAAGPGAFGKSMARVIENPRERMPPLPPSPCGSFHKQQPDYEETKFAPYDPIDQRCLASCCNHNTDSDSPRSLSWTSSTQPLSPNAPSFVPVSPPLAPTTPVPHRAITPTETWDIWGVYKIANTINFSDSDYVRPYPMACDSQEDQAVEDVPLEDYKWTDDEDGTVAINPVWTTLITNLAYLPGLLTLNHSLRAANSKYPLVALYTDSFPQAGHDALHARGIPSQRIDYILPTNGKDYSNDPRFYDCWSKLVPFSLTQYARIVQLDSDMLVLRNMDELMDLPLDSHSSSSSSSSSTRVFAAGHACVCNPLRKPHYPKNWIPQNCAFTSQHADPDAAQTVAADPSVGPLGFMNGGLQVVNPSAALYDQILAHMEADAVNMDFADQSLLSDLYRGRWVPLPYTYNALKTLRWDGVHAQIWRDDQVKNIHYILSPKPWDEIDDEGEWTGTEESHKWWIDTNRKRKAAEKEAGIHDEF
ncbi:hypothetical protein J3F84DRAFT_392406 [Trichoderma pleuroticola]